MANEVIDLTDSLSPGFIAVDTDSEEFDSEESPAVIQRDGNKKKTRRRKRKRPMVEEEKTVNPRKTEKFSLETEASPLQQGKLYLSESEQNPSTEASPEKPHQSHQTKEPHNQKNLYSPSLTKVSSLGPSFSDSDLFFIDVKPASLPVSNLFTVPTAVSNQTDSSLLLPAHVSLFGTTPVEILPSSNINSDEEDYIDYLDIDDHKGMARYFEMPTDETAKKPRMLCKHCGAEGDHKTSECAVLICLTCGARNEHPTRSCPISKTCFSCGMKGHINVTCPNRRRRLSSADESNFDDCNRCGSRSHKTNECPTLWRLYEYFTDQAKERVIHIREERKYLSLGKGGEGYIASDEWCYNCGNSGHWGDDCQNVPHNKDLPNEQSAFSSYNLSSGPFYSPHSRLTLPAPSQRGPREWEITNSSTRDWPSDAPDNVGWQARRKNILRMKEAQEKTIHDDPDDWFGNQRQIGSHNISSRNTDNPSQEPKRISFGKSFRDTTRQFQPLPAKLSLLDRLGDNSHSQEQFIRSSQSRRDEKYFRDKNRYHSQKEPGPRYKGGYRM